MADGEGHRATMAGGEAAVTTGVDRAAAARAARAAAAAVARVARVAAAAVAARAGRKTAVAMGLSSS
jgi:hypothetical protein